MWISRSRIFCVRTQESRICTSISLKWSYQSHRYINYIWCPKYDIIWTENSDVIDSCNSRYWSTIPGSLRPGAKDPGPWDSHPHCRMKVDSLGEQIWYSKRSSYLVKKYLVPTRFFHEQEKCRSTQWGYLYLFLIFLKILWFRMNWRYVNKTLSQFFWSCLN